MALHLHDNDGTGEHHFLPGEGSIDWENVKQNLHQSQYAGPVSLEVLGRSEIESPDKFLNRAYQFVREWFD